MEKWTPERHWKELVASFNHIHAAKGNYDEGTIKLADGLSHAKALIGHLSERVSALQEEIESLKKS
ncbi:hypothetical protein R84981_002807 [Carnimonas sp. R-84981]|uniref:hypothetical protein n=1 Tax=Carnimonas bestiolae TaxID=3402172 RepID=UPI003EDB7FFE